jgi:hypothetical protein
MFKMISLCFTSFFAKPNSNAADGFVKSILSSKENQIHRMVLKQGSLIWHI